MFQRLLIVSLLCSVWGASGPAVLAAERAETLRAINWVENPTNHSRRGSKGELGPYQFRSQTWRLHTSKPFNLAVVREHADEVAVKHYDFICSGLREAGIEPTPFNIALAWNSGLGAVQRGRVPVVSYGYAQRVSNLVESQRAQRAAVAQVVKAAAAGGDATNVTKKSGFELDITTPRFTIAAVPMPLYDPVVTTEKNVPSDAAIPVVRTAEQPAFTFVTVTAPRIALIR